MSTLFSALLNPGVPHEDEHSLSNSTPPTDIYTLSLHDALPIWTIRKRLPRCKMRLKKRLLAFSNLFLSLILHLRSEERFSRNAETDLVCRLLLEKKKQPNTKHDSEKQWSEVQERLSG